MGNNLDKLVTVDIDLNTPLVDGTSFDYMLIIGPPPAVGSGIETVNVYANLAEVTDAGYVTTGDAADPVGVAARVAFSQNPKPTKIYVATVGDTDSVTDILDTALATSGWFVVCPAGIEAAAVNEIIAWTEAQEKMCAYTILDIDAAADNTMLRSFGIFGKETANQADADIPAENRYTNVAWVAKCLNYHAGQETWVHKPLYVVKPAKLTSTEAKKLEDKNISYITTVASKNVTLGGKVLAGEWIDVIRFRDWQKNDMQLRVANLFITNPKVPYTDPGISLIENQMKASLADGVTYGGIAPDEYDEDGTLIPSFVTSVPLAASLTGSQRASRKLTNCTFAARIAGAIHLAEIKGSLTYSL